MKPSSKESGRLDDARPDVSLKSLLVLGLAVVIGAGHALAGEAQSDIDRIAVGFPDKTAEMSDEVARAYRSVFRTNDDEAMTKLLTHESSSIALKAAWRLAELKCTEHPDREPLARFVGFVEGRTKTVVPRWWEACVLGSTFDRDDRRRLVPADWPQVDEELFPINNVELGDQLINVPPGVKVSFDGESLLWESNGMTTRLPRTLLKMEGTVSADWATMRIDGERLYFAAGSDYDGSFGLACLTLSGKEMWRSLGWGIGRFHGGASGLWFCTCEISTAGDQIVVFGRPLGGAFIEAFEPRTGDPVYRFSTRYIEETAQDATKGKQE